KNTSGLGIAGRPPLVLLSTAAGDPTVQCLASSPDGRHFAKYPGNPVVKQVTGGNRDPKVIWHEPTQKWVMVLYVERDQRQTIHFFTSPNLKDWTLASLTEGDPAGKPYLYECPDFFELPVDGHPKHRKWVLLAANSQYAVGTFDGTRFTPEHSRLPGHRGKGVYAPQTFSDLPRQDGRRIQIGWFQTETRGMSFNQSMTLPLELKLASTPEGPRLTFTPVRELQKLRRRSHRIPVRSLAPGDPNPLAALQAELVEVRTEFTPPPGGQVAFSLRGATVVYDAARQELEVNGHRAPAPLRDGRQRLTVYVDRTGLEVLASDGHCYVPLPFQPKADDRSLAMETRGGPARVESLRVHELKSIWPAAGASRAAP
ncbi:MAG: glycoside hydrolase family 32 protein, partial [Verrucomicrobiota bacterium]